MRVPEALIAERDARMFELRKSGLNFRQIAKAADVSTSTAHAGVQRVLKKIGKELVENHGDAWRLELERLDSLMVQLWPLTRPHEIETDDGHKIKIPPSFDAIDRVLKIMDRRAKLMGLDQQGIAEAALGGGGGTQPQVPIIGVPTEGGTGEVTAMEEARNLLKIALAAGVIDRSTVDVEAFGLDPDDIEDAEIIQDEEAMLAIESGERDDSGEIIPPPWAEDEDPGGLPAELPSLPWAEDDDLPDDFDD